MTVFSSIGQKMTRVVVTTTYNQEVLKLDRPYYNSNLEDSIVLIKLKFYLSPHRDSADSYVLYDLEESSTTKFDVQIAENQEILSFYLGVDSTLNMKGVQSGALDPMNDMYWTWNSGYINFKLEGTSLALSTRKNRFQLHLGGFLTPHNAQRIINLATEGISETVILNLDLDQFLNEIDLNHSHTIMSPSKEAMDITDKLVEAFSVKND